MKLIVNRMKIRPKYINLIREGQKKHEFRLNNEYRRSIRVGDYIVLISNQDSNDYVKVKVTKIENFSNWDDALYKYWEDDFKGLYSTKEEALKECFRFYTREQVNQYGIVVFTIEKSITDFKNASFLLDTNIIIYRESLNNRSLEIPELFKALDKVNARKYIHPETISEINEYKDTKIRDMMMVKIKSYDVLTISNENDEYFNEVVSRFGNDKNSAIDNDILLQVYNNRSQFLITEDNIMHLKAKKLFIEDQVLRASDFLRRFNQLYPKLVDYGILSIVKKNIGELNYRDPFFESLREDYNFGKDAFDSWLNKKANDTAYVYEDRDGIKGFLYLKTEYEDEPYNDISPVFTKKKRLKVGTFKISAKGLRISERFLKIILDNAKKRNLDEIYVTLFENKRSEVLVLRDTLIKWGFIKWGLKTSTGETVLVKLLDGYNSSIGVKENYPQIKNNPGYMFLPIMAEYHTKLFPDLLLRNEKTGDIPEKAYSYALEKVYVCKKVPNFKNEPGDLVVVYRMGDTFTYKKYSSVVTGLCILEKVEFPKSPDELVKACGNRTIFGEKFLRDNYYRFNMVIKVIYLEHFKNKITLDRLRYLNILEKNGGAQLSTLLSKENFDIICKEGRGE